jgi:(2Fe-2S) ferredoxin
LSTAVNSMNVDSTKKVIICVNYRANPDQPSCAGRGSRDLARCLKDELAGSHLDIKIEHSDCLGYCEMGPNLKLVPQGRFFHHFKKQDIPAILKQIKQFLLSTPH